jgi:4a-hydroxytetrahydrobiopterin dehydratase
MVETNGRLSEECFMDELTKERCTACRRDSPRVIDAEIAELRPQIPAWTLIEREGIPRLERVFRFSNFADAVAFTNRIAALAEDEGHHPAILTEWGRVTVALWTHKIRALHRNDFVMAAKIDALTPSRPEARQ